MTNPHPLTQRIPKPDEQTATPRQSKYAGRTDYQGNHDVFEMPDDQKPPERLLARIPLKKILLTMILLGVAITFVLIFIEMLKQSGSFT